MITTQPSRRRINIIVILLLLLMLVNRIHHNNAHYTYNCLKNCYIINNNVCCCCYYYVFPNIILDCSDITRTHMNMNMCTCLINPTKPRSALQKSKQKPERENCVSECRTVSTQTIKPVWKRMILVCKCHAA